MNKRGSQSMMNLYHGDDEQFPRNSQRQSHRGPRRGSRHCEVLQQPVQSQSYGNQNHRQPWGRDQNNQGPYLPYHPSHNQGQCPPYNPSHNQGPSYPSHNQGPSPPYNPSHNQGPSHPSHNQGPSPPYHPSHNQGPSPPYNPSHNQGPSYPSHNQGPRPPYHPSHNQGPSPSYRPSHNQGPSPPYNQGPSHPSHNQGQYPPYHPSHNQGPSHPSHNQGQYPPYHPSHNQGPSHPSHNQGQYPPYHPSHNQGPSHPSHNQGQYPPYHPSHNQGPSPPYHPSHNQGPSPLYDQSSRNSCLASQDWQLEPSKNKNQTPSDDRKANCQDYQAFQHGHAPFHNHSGNDRREQYNQTPPPSYDESVRQYERINPSAPPLMDLVLDSDQYSENFFPKNNLFRDQTAGNGSGQKKNLHMQGNPKKSTPSKLCPENLAKILSTFNGHRSTAKSLSKQVNKNVEVVIQLVEAHKKIFSCKNVEDDTEIELLPQVSLCSQYTSPKGCVNRDACHNLHMCKFYIIGFCEAGVNCQYGHQLDTGHNSSILSEFYLNLIDQRKLYNVIQKVCKASFTPEICNFYNTKKGCTKNEGCSRLHLCKDYLKTVGNCSFPKCSFSHDLSTAHCKRLFKRYGISTNETKRDILLTLSQSLHKKDINWTSSVSLGKENTTLSDDSNSKTDDSDEESSSDSESDSDCSEKSDTLKSKGQRKYRKERPDVEDKKTERKKLTVKSTDVCGDVQIPEICVYALDDKCHNAIKGCRYLHAKSLFHWQFEKGSKWYNFRIFQSKVLETAYQDVSKDNVQIPPFDPIKGGSYATELLNIFGTGSWAADFKDMSCKVSSESNKLKIRRISTRSAGESKSPKSTVYNWYFHDEQGKWIRYGQVDSLRKLEFICSTTNDDIEKQFLSDPLSSMVISTCNSKFQYCLNFKEMTQTNLQTKKIREIRRRPSLDTRQKKSTPDSNQNCLPSHWQAMAASQTHVLVALDPTTTEYQKVMGLLRLTLPTASVQKIQRLQNPYLWQQLENKKDFLSRSYDENQLNMQEVFHGTDSSKIDKICKENIDWRQGTTTNQDFGKGNYFSNSAAVARRHCSPDAYGQYSLILADVIIGTTVKGSPTLTRPPVNPNTNALYDTTVDNINAPTVFVKYDKEEYYPKYIIEFL
ncbi:protein mono-ADP-ribosyltransferase PARP12 isoform X2 [Procambarus clarkii]|uniref:protein mono-ADP-ribosyltransferase PARP12 isoform X2 n=1 Tax=Procambarus clarkii TaxID=6728 RepID=UPI0037440A54